MVNVYKPFNLSLHCLTVELGYMHGMSTHWNRLWDINQVYIVSLLNWATSWHVHALESIMGYATSSK